MNPENRPQTNHMTTKAIVCSALLAAISIVLARFLSYAPLGSVRFSFDKFPLFLSGMFFGPLVGGMTGLVADATGSMMQYGFNPILCPPAILYGVFGGLFRHFIAKKTGVLRLAVGYAFPVVIGALLYQSFALAYCFNPSTFWEASLANLGSRTVQFAIIAPLEVLLIAMLMKMRVFERIGIWPPVGWKRK